MSANIVSPHPNACGAGRLDLAGQAEDRCA
jgi:hypothetical protein